MGCTGLCSHKDLVRHPSLVTLGGDTLPARYRYSNPFVVHR